jgi:hypothetical protein
MKPKARGLQLALAPTLVFSLCLSACTPAPVLRLTPVAQVGASQDWHEGQRNVWRDDGQIHAEVNVAWVRHDRLVFAVRFHNAGDSPVLISPERFYYQPVTGPGPDAPPCGSTALALDPERVLLDLDEAEVRADADRETDMAVTGVLALLDVVTSVASAVSDEADASNASTAEEDYEDVDWLWEFAEIDAEHDSKVAAIESQREHWSREVLRKTTLYPGESIGGLVHFATSPKARYLRVVLAVGQEESTFLFRQTVHRGR